MIKKAKEGKKKRRKKKRKKRKKKIYTVRKEKERKKLKKEKEKKKKDIHCTDSNSSIQNHYTGNLTPKSTLAWESFIMLNSVLKVTFRDFHPFSTITENHWPYSSIHQCIQINAHLGILHTCRIKTAALHGRFWLCYTGSIVLL